MSRFELCKFAPAPDPELICGICMNVLDTPYETPCRHVFCRDCILTAIRENQKCPVCRAACREGQTKEVLPLVQNLINKLTMRCDHFDNGCTDLILKEFFLDHVKFCEYAMIQCRYKSCGQNLLRRDCEQHELNTCVYRDRVCENGCGLMIPLENANTHNCIEALVGLVKDLKEQNQELQKTIAQLQASANIAKSESVAATETSQRDDDDWSFHSFTYDNMSDTSYDTTSFSSHSWDTENATEAAWNELSDLVYGRTDRRRSRRIAAMSHGSESDQSVEHLDESFQSQASELPDNESFNDHDNVDRNLDSAGRNVDSADRNLDSAGRNVDSADRDLDIRDLTDGNISEDAPALEADQEIINKVSNYQHRFLTYINGNDAASVDTSSQVALEGGGSSSTLNSPSSSSSPKTSIECLSLATGKRQLEEDSGFCDDNTGKTRVKQIKLSVSHSQECIGTQAEEAALTSTSLSVSNTSELLLLEDAKERPNANTDPTCDSPVNASGDLGLSVAGAVTPAEPPTININTSQSAHTYTSSSDSTNAVSSSSNIRNEGNTLRRGPVTRSRGHDGNIALEGNAIPYVKVPPTFAYLLDMYAQEDDSSDDESWSPSHETLL